MTVTFVLLLVLLGIGLDRAWLWWTASRGYRSRLFTITDARNQAMRDIAEQRRRSEEQLYRAAFRRWLR